MLFLAVPFLILLAIFGASAADDLVGGVELPLPSLQLFPEKISLKPSPAPAPAPQPSRISQAPVGTKALFFLDTEITEGPKEGEAFTETNTFSFSYEGTVLPQDTPGRITFETRMLGAENEEWKSTSSRERNYTLSAGEYTFEVRAQLDKETDSTPAQRNFAVNISPAFGKVDISTARAATSSSPSRIILKPKLSSGETIDITGWRIQSRNGSFTIGKGVEKMNPGITAVPADPIIVERGDTVYMSGAKNPFGAQRNFRPNICMGYIDDSYDFEFSVSNSCSFQKPHISTLLLLSQNCREFILENINYSSCKVPPYPPTPDILLEGSAECASYIKDTFTYNACFQDHQSDENFTEPEWHVYMNSDFLYGDYDIVKLLDENGLLVDTKIIE